MPHSGRRCESHLTRYQFRGCWPSPICSAHPLRLIKQRLEPLVGEAVQVGFVFE